jgi:hypothetical protein
VDLKSGEAEAEQGARSSTEGHHENRKAKVTIYNNRHACPSVRASFLYHLFGRIPGSCRVPSFLLVLLALGVCTVPPRCVVVLVAPSVLVPVRSKHNLKPDPRYTHTSTYTSHFSLSLLASHPYLCLTIRHVVFAARSCSVPLEGLRGYITRHAR